MEIDEEKSVRLFNIKKNQLKLVRRRGYNIDREEPLLSYKLQNFLDAYVPFAKKNRKTLRNVLSQVYQKEVETESGSKIERLYVFYADPDTKHKQLGVETLGEMITEMDRNKAKNGILITPMNLSSQSKKKIEELLTYNIHVFLESEMAYDPTEHWLVPAHRPLGVEEQRGFLERNKISIDQIPIILATDMISRYYGFKPGQVIEIKRANLYETLVQESLSYRVVKDI